MLGLSLPLSSALELKPRTAAEICDSALEVDQLVDSLDGGRPFTRKTLCEFLGIGESTLSGWIKDGRIPRMAKNAIVLLMTQQQLAAEVRRLRDDDLHVVRSGDHYQVCDLHEDEEGEFVGRVIADRIPTLEDARLLASGRRALRLMQGMESAVEEVIEISNDCGNRSAVQDFQSIQEQSEAHALFLTDYQQWKERFGKKTSAERLAHMLDDLLDAPSKQSASTYTSKEAPQ